MPDVAGTDGVGSTSFPFGTRIPRQERCQVGAQFDPMRVSVLATSGIYRAVSVMARLDFDGHRNYSHGEVKNKTGRKPTTKGKNEKTNSRTNGEAR